jgi:hypothetical protein
MYACEPLIGLSGAKKNQLLVNLPSAITQGQFTYIDDAGQSNFYLINRVAILLRGLNAQNGATFQN